MCHAASPLRGGHGVRLTGKHVAGGSKRQATGSQGGGKVYFRNESYGLAAQSYQKAVEVTPKDAEAWLGLAASYDHLRRFDLADQAYAKVLQLGSQNAVILNNAGYSQLLRGNLASARKFLLRAYELQPDNPYIQNNLKLLGESEKSVKRSGK